MEPTMTTPQSLGSTIVFVMGTRLLVGSRSRALSFADVGCVRAPVTILPQKS